MEWIDKKYEVGTLENKIAKQIWFLDAGRLNYFLSNSVGKTLPTKFIEEHRDEVTKHLMHKDNYKQVASVLSKGYKHFTKKEGK